MVMNLSPRFLLSCLFPPNDGASLPPDLCPFSSNLNLLINSKFDNSPASSSQLHSTFAWGESSEGAPWSEGSSGLSSTSASSLEEKPNCKHGQEMRRKLRGTRGGRERGINKSGHTLYKGVRKREGGRWVSEIREPGKKSRIWLGTFSTAEMAATAYDVAAFNLKTPCAYLNFPQHVSSLPILPSRSPKHIQQAAASVAHLRGPASCTHIRTNGGGLVPTPTRQVDESSTSLSTEQQQELSQCISVETRTYSLIEEDMIFDMPNVLADMANGLMITPPLYYLATPTNADNNTSAWDTTAESSLWNL